MTYEIEDIAIPDYPSALAVDFDIGKNVTGIYEIININNGKKYIGSAVNIKKRWDLHKLDCRKQKHHSIALQRAYDKYGLSIFQFNILEVCEKENLLNREQYYLDTFNPEYNCCKIAGSPLGVIATEERKAKISAKHKGRKLTEEWCNKISLSKKGSILSKEHRDKISTSGKGKHGGPKSPEHAAKIAENNRTRALNGVSLETRNKLSEAGKGNKNAKGHIHSEETRSKMATNKGKKFSEEHKAKMREAWERRKADPNYKPPRSGKKHSQETKIKMAIAARARSV